MINNCCPSIKSRLDKYVNGAVSGGSDAIRTACVGNQPPQSFVNTCSMIHKLENIIQDTDFQKYIDVLTTALSGIQSPSIDVQRPCSSDEAYATLCNRTHRNHLESCERKTLEYVEEHNTGDQYRRFVQESKKNLRLLIDEINKVFPVESTIEPMTSDTTIEPTMTDSIIDPTTSGSVFRPMTVGSTIKPMICSSSTIEPTMSVNSTKSTTFANSTEPTTSSSTITPPTCGATKVVERMVWVFVTLLSLIVLVFFCDN